MWDQQLTMLPKLQCIRIIPTHVGSTIGYYVRPEGGTNHSHACGINERSIRTVLRRLESFPRMWDQPHPHDGVAVHGRIIPTHVGSTKIACIVIQILSNHSHACGINSSIRHFEAMAIESFPRMWDQRGVLLSHKITMRIIPTHVGSTSF